MYKIVQNAPTQLDIYISGVIEEEKSLELANEIKLAGESGVTDLVIHINSYGGSVKGAWDIVSAFKNSGMKVTAINEGFAVSAASLILAAADYSKAYDYSTALIHDPLMGNKTLAKTSGSDREFLTKIKDGLMSIYQAKFNISTESLSTMMTKETSLNAQDQKNIGLVNEIIFRKNKPSLKNTLSTLDIYNIYEQYNITETEIMNETIENQEVENATPVVPTITCPKCGEKIPMPIEDGCGKKTKAELDEETTNKIVEITNELNSLKVENFILKNSLTEKSEMINNAVSKHGIEVLDTILEFINLTPVVEAKVEPVVNTALLDELHTIVNNANAIISNEVIVATETEEDMEKLAFEIFDIKGSNKKRLEVKNENPELYEKLFDIYSNKI